jgi:hypothetical protein
MRDSMGNQRGRLRAGFPDFSLRPGSPLLLKGFAKRLILLFNGFAEDGIHESMEESDLRLFENNGRSDRSDLSLRDQADLPIC